MTSAPRASSSGAASRHSRSSPRAAGRSIRRRSARRPRRRPTSSTCAPSRVRAGESCSRAIACAACTGAAACPPGCSSWPLVCYWGASRDGERLGLRNALATGASSLRRLQGRSPAEEVADAGLAHPALDIALHGPPHLPRVVLVAPASPRRVGPDEADGRDVPEYGDEEPDHPEEELPLEDRDDGGQEGERE